jgi:hypothetical protein
MLTPDDRRIENHTSQPTEGIFAEIELPINVSGLFYRETGGACLGGQQAGERWDP